jgi:hypothetical protein
MPSRLTVNMSVWAGRGFLEGIIKWKKHLKKEIMYFRTQQFSKVKDRKKGE